MGRGRSGTPGNGNNIRGRGAGQAGPRQEVQSRVRGEGAQGLALVEPQQTRVRGEATQPQVQQEEWRHL